MAKRKKQCDKKPIKKQWIEDIVIKYTMKVIMDDTLIEHIADSILRLLGEENSKIPQLKSRLKEVQTGIDNMINAIQQGIITPSTKQRLDELEMSKNEIEVAIFSEELQKPEITKEHIIYWITRFRSIDTTDLDSRKRLVDSFVNSVYIYDDDKVAFTFNYKDGTKTVSLEELESELGSDLFGLSPPNRVII